MRVLVTGGTGFLGTALVHRMVELNYEARVLIRPSSDISALPPGVDTALGNVTALDSLVAAAQGMDAIIHMAALVQAWAKKPSDFDRINVEGIRNVLHVLRSVPSVKRLLYTSTFFAIGPTHGTVADGSQEHSGRDFCTDYERTKYEADQIARRAVAEEGLDVVLVYPGVIYGPGKVNTANLLVKMIVDHFDGKLPGYVGEGRALNCFVHVNDVVSGILAALDRGVPGKRYILGGENAGIVTVFETVQAITGKAPPSRHIPLWLVTILGFFSVIVAHLGGPIPIFTHKSVQAFKHDWAYKSDAASHDLGYSPLSLRQGLDDTLSWLRGTGRIKY